VGKPETVAVCDPAAELFTLAERSPSVRFWRTEPSTGGVLLWENELWRRTKWQDFLSAGDAQAVSKQIAACVAGDLVVQLCGGCWGWRYARIAIAPCKDGWGGTLIDVTVEREAAQRARGVEKELDALLSAPAAVAIFDREMRYLRASSRWKSDYELEGQEIIGRSHYEVFPELPERWKQIHRRCLEGISERCEEDPFDLAQGSRIWIKWEVRPWWLEDGTVGGLVMLTEDITLRKQSESALFRIQNTFQIAIDAMPQRVFWKDREGRYLGCNQGFAEDAGLRSPAEVIGRTDHELVWWEHAVQFQPDDAAVRESGVARLNFEEALTISEGARWVRMSKIPLRDATGTMFGCLGVFQDITDERARGEELRRARDAAEKASRIKSEFLASMSHELRTPMHGILGMVELVLESQLNQDQKECLDAIQSSAKVLLHIINDILDLSKIEAGKLQLAPEPFQLSVFLKSSLRLLESSAKGKGLEFSLTVEDGTPEFWRGDQVRLAQILTNLVGNAVKFTPEDGKIGVRAKAFGEADGWGILVLEVTDTGIGISKSKQETIFDAFTQADGATTKQFGGTGLGLTITRQLAELMSGRISVSSDLGKGSTFTCTCRLEVLTEEAFGALTVTQQEGGNELTRNRMIEPLEILLVEDNPVNQRIGQRLLEREGATVTLANDGWEALELLDREGLHARFDMVLMDCLMPVMNGWDATRAIRQREEGSDKHLSVVAITASVMESDRRRCIESGMDDVLAKPIEREHLRKVLENARRTRALARLSYNLQ
jgi:PAS domain S-box-containing protein